jgi:hypothetical protein
MPRADLLEQRGLGDIALVLPQGGKQVAGKGHALAVGCSADERRRRPDGHREVLRLDDEGHAKVTCSSRWSS